MDAFPEKDLQSFPYTNAQVHSIFVATLASSSITIVFSIVILLFYAYFFFSDRSNADRVSLRCVVFACFTNIINSIVNIAMCSIVGGHTSCRALDVFFNFLDVLSAGLLSVVGINLVLIFVIKIRPTKYLERFYYPCTLLYSILLIILPVYEETVSARSKSSDRNNCWYDSNIRNRNRNPGSWMYFYCLIFFITVVGLVSAIAAVTKLILSEYQNFTILQASNGYRGRTSMTDRRFSRSRITTRIIVRCIIYSLVPFVTHTWGFIIQILVLRHATVPYGLMMTSAILTYLEGTITVIIFFTEPVVCAFIRAAWKGWYQMYVEEFRIVVRTERRRSSATLFSLSTETIEIKSIARMQPRSPTTRDKRPIPPDADIGDAELLRMPTLPEEEESEYTTRIVPMRRVSITQPMYKRLSSQTGRQSRRSSIASSQTESEGSTQENVVISPNTPDEVFIPYHFPMLARVAHSIFLLFSRSKNDREGNETGLVLPERDLEELPPRSNDQIDNLSTTSL